MKKIVSIIVLAFVFTANGYSKIIKSGFCGPSDNYGSVQWKLEDNGLLTISGNSAITLK